MRQVLIFLCALGCFENRATAQIAFIGDSLSTGGAAHPQLKIERQDFTAVLRGEQTFVPDEAYYQTLEAQDFAFMPEQTYPRRLFPTSREYRNPLVWFVDNLWMSFGIQYLDAEKYAWPYLVSRHLGYSGEQILIAAKDGERMEHAVRQFDRVLAVTDGKLPEHTFVFFTGNDLCGPRMEFVTTTMVFQRHLEKLVHYVLKNADSSSQPRHLWLVEPLGVLQIVTSDSILRHRVPFHDKEISCRDMQTLPPKPPTWDFAEGQDVANFLFPLVANAPSGYCPTLFSVHGEQGSESNVALANRILGYREAIRNVAKDMAPQLREKNIELHNIRSTSQVVFEGEDMANDCFHINLNGHIKVAKAVHATVQEKTSAE
ncbi:MAG: SGNH/GDSL hydrolase family protein [Oligoflexus sp.]